MVDIKVKKKLSYFVIATNFLLGGVEYAVILPTLWLYLQERFNSQPFMLGLILSAFSFSGLLAGPLMGRWSDVSKNTKLVILVGNTFEIAGNLMYFVGLSDWFLVAGRFVAGIGSGVGPAIMADITRVTTVSERTAVISVLMMTRQFGLLAGPGLNLFLRELDFYIGPFRVNKFSSPGLFMALVWTAQQLLVLFCYWNLPKLHEQEKEALLQDSMHYTPSESSEQADDSHQDSEPEHDTVTGDSSPTVDNSAPVRPPSLPRQISLLLESPIGDVAASSENIVHAERYMNATPDGSHEDAVVDDANMQRMPSASGTYGSVNGVSNCRDHVFDPDQHTYRTYNTVEHNASKEQPPGPIRITKAFLYQEYVREEVVLILFVVFVTFFNQLVLETSVTPLTKTYLNWGELENSLLYCLAGVQTVIVFILIRVASRRVSDRVLMLLGLFIILVTDAFLVWFLPQATPGKPDENLWGMVLGVFLDLIGIPIVSVISVSLYSKVTRPETQGLSQGIRRMAAGLGLILGPLWTGGMIYNLYAMYGVALALNVIAVVMYLLSFSRLGEKPELVAPVQQREEHEPVVPVQQREEDERTPLIA